EKLSLHRPTARRYGKTRGPRHFGTVAHSEHGPSHSAQSELARRLRSGACRCRSGDSERSAHRSAHRTPTTTRGEGRNDGLGRSKIRTPKPGLFDRIEG